jgi:hypothetical protein
VLVGAAHIALASSFGSIVPNSDRTLTVSGRQSFVIPAGAPLVSDPVDFDLGASLPTGTARPQMQTRAGQTFWPSAWPTLVVQPAYQRRS